MDIPLKHRFLSEQWNILLLLLPPDAPHTCWRGYFNPLEKILVGHGVMQGTEEREEVSLCTEKRAIDGYYILPQVSHFKRDIPD